MTHVLELKRSEILFKMSSLRNFLGTFFLFQKNLKRYSISEFQNNNSCYFNESKIKNYFVNVLEIKYIKFECGLLNGVKIKNAINITSAELPLAKLYGRIFERPFNSKLVISHVTSCIAINFKIINSHGIRYVYMWTGTETLV